MVMQLLLSFYQSEKIKNLTDNIFLVLYLSSASTNQNYLAINIHINSILNADKTLLENKLSTGGCTEKCSIEL